jgi:hypothetical protein
MRAPNLICNSSIISDTEISHVMETFESINNEWFARGEEEQGSCFNESLPLFKRREFLGNECCETCKENPDCLCALSTGRDCLTASHLETDSLMLLNLVSFWMDDASKRGNFCDLCECREDDRAIDCSGRDLLIVPKTFHAASSPTWTPRVLDLQGNPKLVLLGAGSLAMILETLARSYGCL